MTTGCTTLILDEPTHANGMDGRTVAHGVVELTLTKSEYGVERRRLSVDKLRGVTSLDGVGSRFFVALPRATPPTDPGVEAGGHLGAGSPRRGQ